MLLTNLFSFSPRSSLAALISAESAEPTHPVLNTWRSDPDVLERRRVIDELISLNPSATVEFLDEFTTESLQDYLAHLHATQQPRGRAARWRTNSLLRGIESHETFC